MSGGLSEKVKDQALIKDGAVAVERGGGRRCGLVGPDVGAISGMPGRKRIDRDT